jgi:hypothetical protein
MPVWPSIFAKFAVAGKPILTYKDCHISYINITYINFYYQG